MRESRRALVLPALLASSLAGLGSTWFDGLGVDVDSYGPPAGARTYLSGGMLRGLSVRLADDLEATPIADLVTRCDEVIVAGRESLERLYTAADAGATHYFASEVGGPEIRAWLVCMAAIELMSRSGDPQWVGTLERYHGEWQEAAGPQRIGMDILWQVLSELTVEAYVSLALDDMDLAQLATEMRLAILRSANAPPPTGVSLRGHAMGRRMGTLAGQGPWPPELRSMWVDSEPLVRLRMVRSGLVFGGMSDADLPLLVGMLNDPDAEVRESVRNSLVSGRSLRVRLVSPLVDFLSRNDIDDTARRHAEEALRFRGYELVPGGSGIEVVSDPLARQRVYVDWLADADPARRSQAAWNLRQKRSPASSTVPLILALLAREDLDDMARLLATSVIRDLGFEPVTGPGGCLMAKPVGGDGPPILQDGCEAAK